MARPVTTGAAARARANAKHPDGPEAAQWLECLSDGQTIRQACKASGLAWSTINGWLRTQPAFQARYAQARAAGAHIHADKAGDVLEEVAEQITAMAEASAMVTVAKAQSEYYRWRASTGNREYRPAEKIEQDTTVRVLVEYASPPAAELAAPSHPARIAAPPTEPAQLAEYTIEVDP